MSKSDVKERRAHERLPTAIDIHGTHDDGGVVARMVARNLSIGGLYCTSPKDFPEMARLAVRLMLPRKDARNGGTAPLDLEAVVVRREKLPASSNGDDRFEVALFFTNMEETAREQLRCYLDKRAI